MGKKINLDDLIGKQAKDMINGFEGTITGYAVYTTGEPRIQIEALDSICRPYEHWTDLGRIEIESEKA